MHIYDNETSLEVHHRVKMTSIARQGLDIFIVLFISTLSIQININLAENVQILEFSQIINVTIEREYLTSRTSRSKLECAKECALCVNCEMWKFYKANKTCHLYMQVKTIQIVCN